MLDTIGDLVVINLPERQDRRQEFTQQLTRIGLSESDPRVRFFSAIRPDNAGPFRTIGARGCFLSHLGILRQACAEGADRILICEDDLNFSSDFNLRAPDIMASLAGHEWDIFYGFPPDQATSQADGLVLIPGDQPLICTHFMALRRPALEAVFPILTGCSPARVAILRAGRWMWMAPIAGSGANTRRCEPSPLLPPWDTSARQERMSPSRG